MSFEAADDPVSQVEARLISHGVYVEELSRGDAGFSLTYESVHEWESDRVPDRELGRVVNVFRDVFGEDWSGERIEATVVDADGAPLADWHVQQEWLAGLGSDELSEVAFSRAVLGTVEVR